MFWRIFGVFGTIALISTTALAWIVHRRVDPGWESGGLFVAAACCTMLAVLLGSWVLSRRFSKPLGELTASAGQIAQGAFGHKVYAGRDDEIGALAHAFDHMSEQLADQFAQLAKDHQQLRAVLSGMVEGVIAVDAEQRIVFANERAADLLDFVVQGSVGRRLWEVVRYRPIHELVRRALANPGPCRDELSFTGPVNKSLTVHLAQLPGPPAGGFVLVFHDTTELRTLERLRQDFVANVSHELKTPLSVITACAETLLGGAAEDPKHGKRFLEQIADQASRLHALILDLLSLARIESGTEAFETQPVPLDPVVAACLERYVPRARSKNQSLEALPPAVADDRPVAAWADPEAVGQILDNLVDNALKYTPEGGRITIRWRSDAERVYLEVADNGIGIPEQDLPRIFERFYRVDKARSRELGGTGLGLSIVKHLVVAMDGVIRTSSLLGSGTTFQVTLPRSATVPTAKALS